MAELAGRAGRVRWLQGFDDVILLFLISIISVSDHRPSVEGNFFALKIPWKRR